VTPDDFRKIALSMPEAIESAHMGHPDFRVGGKIFATLMYPDGDSGMVKLNPEQQAQLVKSKPRIFAPIPGGWGKKGATLVHLKAATRTAVRSAMLTAWTNTAPKRLIEASTRTDAS
jgi:hypothetical protein